MFQRFPNFQRLITWTKPDAPAERGTREYEWYDQNSLTAAEPHLRALVPELMDRSFDLPSRAEMEAGLVRFAERAKITARYGCRWQATRREEDGTLVLETSDGEYRCRAAVFAIGVTEPWTPSIPGIEHGRHYVDVGDASAYRDRRVFVIGKRNSGFEIAQALLPWAREVTVASPRPVKTGTLGLSALRARYLHPYDEHARGGPGTYVLDASIERIERRGDAIHVTTHGTTHPGRLDQEVDDVVLATGFRTPLADLPKLGLVTSNDGRIPALTPFWESVSLPGVYFAGNTSTGAKGLERRGLGALSSAVGGFRYNAGVLARHMARTRFGVDPSTPVLEREQIVPYLLRELSLAPELRVQKDYLTHVLTWHADGVRDDGILPLAHFLDGSGTGVAATIAVDETGTISPVVYVRRDGDVTEHGLPPHPLHAYSGAAYAVELEARLGSLVR